MLNDESRGWMLTDRLTGESSERTPLSGRTQGNDAFRVVLGGGWRGGQGYRTTAWHMMRATYE